MKYKHRERRIKHIRALREYTSIGMYEARNIFDQWLYYEPYWFVMGLTTLLRVMAFFRRLPWKLRMWRRTTLRKYVAA